MLIEQAQDDFPNAWALCELDNDEVLNIILPYHIAEHGSDELIGRKGMSVSKVLERLKHNSAYIRNNPICASKIDYWRMKPFASVFLSAGPITATRQKLVDPKLGCLFHIDGLHRLISWGMEGRFEKDVYQSNPKLTAYVAGGLNMYDGRGGLSSPLRPG